MEPAGSVVRRRGSHADGDFPADNPEKLRFSGMVPYFWTPFDGQSSHVGLLQLARESEANKAAHHCSHLCHDPGSQCMADGHLLLEPGAVNMHLRANCPGIIQVMIKGVLEDVQTPLPHVSSFSLTYKPSLYAVNFNKQL
jgi:hypothetical protein